MKSCKQCGVDITLCDGRKDKQYCNDDCGQKFRQRKHYKMHPDYYKAKRLEHNSDVEKRIYTRIKSRAKLAGIPFDLEKSDIVVPEVCPVLGIYLVTISGLGANQYTSPSVARIDPEKGYTKGNIRVISQRANLLKSNATIEELTRVLEDLKCLERN